MSIDDSVLIVLQLLLQVRDLAHLAQSLLLEVRLQYLQLFLGHRGPDRQLRALFL